MPEIRVDAIDQLDDHERVMLLVPADVLHSRCPDEHYAAEAEAARDRGFEVFLVDHDGLCRPDGAARAVARVAEEGEAVYRGWMLHGERYAGFATALAARGVVLRTTTEQYRRAHELPGWYPGLAALTPPSVWTVDTDRASFDRARADLGPGAAVVRDHVKSMKNYWHEATYIPDLTDADAAWAVANRLRQLREDEFTGGYVLRRFEHFTDAEVRTWWVDGVCRLVGPHPDTPTDMPPADLDLEALADPIRTLDLPFVTVDLARRADGVWRVVELGDGQVSDRPSTIAPDALIAILAPSTE
jgi:hypothetical protein